MLASIRVMAALVIVFSASLATAREDDDAKGYLGVAIGTSDKGGLDIKSLQDESPAMKAGLKENDRIIKMNGEAVGSLQEFVEKIRKTKPGTEIKLLIVRDADEKEIKVKVGVAPKDAE